MSSPFTPPPPTRPRARDTHCTTTVAFTSKSSHAITVTPSQTTMTQHFGKRYASLIDLSLQEDSDDDFELKKKRARHFVNHPIETLALSGDIVMSTAKELKHPPLLFGDIDPGYLFFGLVKSGDMNMVDVA